MRRILTMLFVSVFMLSLCPLHAQETETLVLIDTDMGKIKVKLFNDTPLHRDNFIKNVKEHRYDGLLFHRVIKQFMIQGGDINSKDAPLDAHLGDGDLDYTIPAEFVYPKYFHKKGALAAPRQPDDVNPQKKSDMSQFFIVQGKVYRETELDTLERTANYPARQKALKEFYAPVRAELNMIKMSNKREYQKRLRMINAQIDSVIQATPGHLLFTDEQRKAYTTVGGCHHLDGTYTIFGELTEGFDVLDQIATQPKDQNDRPKKDIRIQNITIE